MASAAVGSKLILLCIVSTIVWVLSLFPWFVIQYVVSIILIVKREMIAFLELFS